MNKLYLFGLTLVMSNVVNASDINGKNELLLDNEKVKVVRLTYPPGTESGFHSHEYPNRVVHFIQGGKLELTTKGIQATKVINVFDGQTLYVPASTHNVKNVGQSTVIILETEIK